MPFDPIGLLERAYCSTENPGAWLREQAMEIVAPFDHDGFGAVTYFIRDFRFDPREIEYQPGRGKPLEPERAFASLLSGTAHSTPEQIERAMLAMQQPGVHSFVDTFGAMIPEGLEPLGRPVADSPAVMVPTGERCVAVITTLSPRRLSLSAEQRVLWESLTMHLGAACRISARADSPDAPDVEAVLDPSGKVLDARGPAQARSHQESLRRAATGMERARTRAKRAEPLRALQDWPALFAGRWSLTEHVDPDRRRFVLARRNDPDPADPVVLSRRQRQVLFYASVGWSLKQIAYALGLAEGTINRHLRVALQKVGLTSRAELIRTTVERAMALAAPLAPPDDRCLTRAEWAVAELIRAGASNQAIAKERNASVRTVANQLTSIYQKLGLRDRHELIRWMSRRGASRDAVSDVP